MLRTGMRVGPARRRESRARERRGSIVILVATLMVVLIGILAFAVDFGRMYLDRAQVHVSADAAALAGADRLVRLAPTRAVDSALSYGRVNLVENQTPTIEVADVVPGQWDFTTRTFTGTGSWTSPNTNAVQATSRFTTQYLFGRIFGATTKLRSATSIAAVGSVRWTTCVKPFAIRYDALISQLNSTAPVPVPLKLNTDPLTAADLQKIATWTNAQEVGFTYNLKVAASMWEFAPVHLPDQTGGAYNSGAFDDLIAAQCASALMQDQHVGPGSVLGQDQGQSMGQLAGGLAGWCDKSGTKHGGNQDVDCQSGPGPMRVALVDPLAGGTYTVRALLAFNMTRYDKKTEALYGYFTTTPVTGPFLPATGALKRIGLVQ